MDIIAWVLIWLFVPTIFDDFFVRVDRLLGLKKSDLE